MSDDTMFQEAVNAVHQGQRQRAKDLFTRLLRTHQNNPEIWLWMSAVVDTPNERIYCLQTVLRLDPSHALARRGLILAGALPADESIQPVPPPRRRWSLALDQQAVQDSQPRGLQAWIQKLPPFFRARPVLIGGAVALGLVFIGCLAAAGSLMFRPAPTPTRALSAVTARPSVTLTPSLTPTPTETPAVRSPTPTLKGATPLWMLLAATYTATPRYIGTPHAISEAYFDGMEDFDRGEYASAAAGLKQAANEDPSAVDILYYLGESYRLLGKYDDALQTFNQAVSLDPGFAPSYLGRALATLGKKPGADVREDLDEAVALDPNLLEAYLARAEYRLGQDDLAGAQADLEVAYNLRTDHPMFYVLRARLHLRAGENEKALQDASQAKFLDLTLLPAYLILGQAQLANDLPQAAAENLRTYTLYEKKNVDAWFYLGKASYLSEQYDQALDALEDALALNKRMGEAFHYRGLTYLALAENQKAIEDLASAAMILPKSFEVHLDFGRALMLEDRYNEAAKRLTTAKTLAETDAQLAQVYFWRAQVYELATNFKPAAQDWTELLALPEGAAPAEWLQMAQERLLALTPTPKISPTPEATATPTKKP